MSVSLTEPLAPLAAPDEARPASAERAPVEPSVEYGRALGLIELRAQLRGVGMWTPAHASFDAWVAAGMPRDLHVSEGEWPRPPAALLHSRLRRRTSTLTRATVTALEAALDHGGAAIDEVRFVLVSSFGEIETTVALLEQLGDPEGPVSPTKFHNSVHNTATGYLSIASGNHREATALAGGPHNLEIGVLEALTGLAQTGGDVALIFAEELLPAPFSRGDADPSFAVALYLSAQRPGPEQPRSLDVELCLTHRRTPLLATPVAPGVEGVGLPTMVEPLVELLRSVAGLAPGQAPRRLALAGGDPSVEGQWIASLHTP